MHPNPAFRQTPADRNLAFARKRGFGALILNGAEGPFCAHVPFLMSESGLEIDLHLARSNPIARSPLPAQALLAVSGEDAYISPDWYGMEDQVPTWNYVAVHLRGTLSPLPKEALQPHVEALSTRFEADLAPKPIWKTGKMSEGALDRLLRMILPFRLSVASVVGTWKLGQNKPEAARHSAAAGVEAQGGAALARLMREAQG